MKEKNNKEKLNAGFIKKQEEEKLMLEKLSDEISKKYNIEKNEAKNLIQNNTLKSLDSLRSQIREGDDTQLNKLSEKELENLFLTIKGAQELIENLSKIEIKVLKKDVENYISSNDIKNKLENYLSKELINKAKNPKLIHEHILGIALGSANTIVAIIDALYQIGAGIIKAPYDLYLVISGKAEIDGVDEI